MTEPSPLPPRRRDSRNLADLIRQNKTNLGQLGRGFVGGRDPRIRPLGSAALYGDLEDDSSDIDTERIEFSNSDRVVASTDGTVTLVLTHQPIDGSLHVRWDGDDLEPTEWTLSSRTLTFTNQHVKVGDIITAAYAYYPSDAVPTPVEWGSTGPNFGVTEGSATDYSSPAFDDSGWAEGVAPLGHPTGPIVGYPTDWLPAVTDVGSVDTGFWIRRTFELDSDESVAVSARADGQYWLYLDGDLIDSYTGAASANWNAGPIPAYLTAGSHVVALHVNDDTSDAGTDVIYGDVRVGLA